jgi:hypothetical protein
MVYNEELIRFLIKYKRNYLSNKLRIKSYGKKKASIHGSNQRFQRSKYRLLQKKEGPNQESHGNFKTVRR